MIKKILILSGICLALAAAATVGMGTWAYNSVPEFYEAALAQGIPQEERQEAAQSLEENAKRLAEELKSPDQWSEEFTQTQINSWLIEVFDGGQTEWRVEEIRQPRVLLSGDTIQVGFQYSYDGWEGVASLRVRPYLHAPNQLALEIQDARVGLIPLPLEEVKSKLNTQLSRRDLEVEWQEQAGKQVALINLNQKTDRGPRLEAIEMSDGKIKLSGQGAEPDKKSGRKTTRSTHRAARVAHRLDLTSGYEFDWKS